jgi:peroxiredoxin
MKTLRTLLGAFVVLTSVATAQSDKSSKSPADTAAAAFFKLRDNKEAKPDQAKLIATGLAFLTEHAESSRAGAVINGLATYGDKGAQRLAWISMLQFEILNLRQKAELSDVARAAIGALDAAVAGVEAREAYNKENMGAYREKIDAVTQMPGSDRFLTALEADYVDILLRKRPVAAENHLKKLLDHPDKKVASMAKKELNIQEVKKQPYELKFTALDGRAVDMSTLRGKFVLLSFWSTTAKNAAEEQRHLRDIQQMYGKHGFEIIGIALDPAANKEQVEKFVKENKISWPQYFDGNGAANDFAPKLNITSAPALVMFDKTGTLATTAVRLNNLEKDLRASFGIKEVPTEPKRPKIK